MTIHGLTDIDSLALSVRDPESKRLIGEAISAYRGGAFTLTRPLAYVVSNSPNLSLRSEGPSNQFVALRQR